MRYDDNEVVRALTEWLREAAEDKRQRRARDQEERAPSHSKSRQLLENASSISALVGVLGLVAGGGWAVVTFLDQQQQRIVQQRMQLESERRQAISKFAIEITDPARRNAAAYALATLGAVDALPLLSSHLVEAIKAGNELTFVNALSRAFIMLGEPALPEVAKINRERAQTGWRDDPLVRVSSKILVEILRRSEPVLHDAAGPAADSDRPRGNGDARGVNTVTLAGVVLVAIDLSYETIVGLGMPGGRILDGNLCAAKLLDLDIRNGTISESTFDRSELQSARVDGSRIETDLRNVQAVNLSARGADFTGSTLAFGVFDGAAMQNAKLSATDGEGATFRNANLSGADLRGGNFTSASFAGANLTGAKLLDVAEPLQAPQLPTRVTLKHPWTNTFTMGSGAFVLGAIFTNSTGLDEATRAYLCRWGAVDVPGRCDGIEPVKFEIEEPGHSGSCF